ncbi:MAG: cytochrome c, partial [Planctomycetes bacterium]|nr:cytochrome c [Planctomycetota bacterium]
DAPSVLAAIDDRDPKIKAQGLRLAETLAAADVVRERVLNLPNPPGRALRRQLLHTLGALGGADAERAMERILRESCDTRSERDAAVSGLWRRELEFLGRLNAAAAWAKKGAGRAALVKSLAACVTTEGNGPRVRRLIDMAIAETTAPWQRRAILDGIASKKLRALRLDAEPAAKLPSRIASFTTWPGKEDWEQLRLRPLTAPEKALFDTGRQFYSLVCRGCHQANGSGMDSLAPPLRNSEWVTGSPSRLVRILVNGVAGPIEVRGKAYDMQMPGLPSFSDEEVAGVLTFIRRSFGHEADPVGVELVSRERKALGDRTSAWSADELKHVK